MNFEETGNPAIAQLWGRYRIKELMNLMVSGETKLGVEAVTDTALTYQMLSQYTAFVAVSDDVRVDSLQETVSVQVPVEMAEGISYLGIFGSAVSAAAPIMANMVSPAPVVQRKRSLLSPGAPEAESFLFEPPPVIAPGEELESLSLYDFSGGILEEAPPPKMSRYEEQYRAFDESIEDEEPFLAEISPVELLEVVSVTGLDQQMIALLTQYLESLPLHTAYSGDLVFELQISKGRVRQVLLDEQASTFKEQEVIDIIRRSLISWQPPQILTATVLLTIRVQA